MHSPHDKFVKESLKNLAVARDFVRAFVPEQIYSAIDINTLALADKEFTTKSHKKIEADILYKCNMQNEPGVVYILVEHQSTADKSMPFRMLRYCVNLIAEHLAHLGARRNHPLPIVVPICIYNGANVYPYSNNIYDCFASPHLAKLSNIFSFKMIDLAAMSNEHILAGNKESLLSYFLKNSRRSDLLSFLEQQSETEKLRVLFEKSKGEVDLMLLMQYLCSVTDYSDGQATRILSIMGKLSGKESVMRFEDALKRESYNSGLAEGVTKGLSQGISQGISQGVSKGELQAKSAVAIKMYKRGMSLADIASLTELSLTEVKKLVAACEAH